MLEALNAHADLKGFEAWDVVPEAHTPLDTFGRPRQHDLIAIGVAEGGPTLVAVEAKAAEPFGKKSVGQELAAGLGAKRSRVPERIAEMVAALPGQAKPAVRTGEALPPELAGCGYQLLTGTVGAVIEAGRRHCPNAVFMVHAFRHDQPTGALAATYAEADADFDAFCRFLKVVAPGFGTVSDPVTPQETDFAPRGVQLFLGKCVTYVA